MSEGDFLCEYTLGATTEGGYSGAFSTKVSASGEAYADDAMGCSYRVGFEMAFLSK